MSDTQGAGSASRQDLFDEMVAEDDSAKRGRLTKAYVQALKHDVFEERRRRASAPRMALRPDHEFPDEMDDIVVKDVETFRAEAMSKDNWWMACYFRNGGQVTFSVHRETKPPRLSVYVTETPAEWVDIDAERRSSDVPV